MARKKLSEVNLETDIEEEDEEVVLEKVQDEIEELPPTMSDPEWEAYAMSQFVSTELDSGRPKVHGLRRVVRKLLGPIIESYAHTIAPPTMENGQRATVEYTVLVYQNKSLEPGEEPRDITYTDVSDAWQENVNGAEFARHPTATCSTRSESRALRKMLNLTTPAAEEIVDLPADENAMSGYVSDSQVTRIDLKCEELDVNVLKFVNMGKNKYNNVKDVPYVKAQIMCKLLGQYDRKEKEIPENIKGYDPNWSDK